MCTKKFDVIINELKQRLELTEKKNFQLESELNLLKTTTPAHSSSKLPQFSSTNSNTVTNTTITIASKLEKLILDSSLSNMSNISNDN